MVAQPVLHDTGEVLSQCGTHDLLGEPEPRQPCTGQLLIRPPLLGAIPRTAPAPGHTTARSASSRTAGTPASGSPPPSAQSHSGPSPVPDRRRARATSLSLADRARAVALRPASSHCRRAHTRSARMCRRRSVKSQDASNVSPLVDRYSGAVPPWWPHRSLPPWRRRTEAGAAREPARGPQSGPSCHR
jgi:hypothetical protein